MAVTTQELIARWIEPDPRRPGPAEARLRDAKVAVWAIIGYLQMVGEDRRRAAAAYDIPLEAVEAAVAYYREHRAAVDARLAANAA